MQAIDKREFLTRQSDLISERDLKEYPITIIGAGAIGSWVALCLAKMGIDNITVWDYDKVDTVNMNCQFFGIADIGSLKVDALKSLVLQLTGVSIKTKPEKYTDASGNLRGIVISAVDSMAVRKLIYNSCMFAPYVIDPRMAIEDALMYVIRPQSSADRTMYEKTLYSDEDAVQERCTSKATIYTANLLAGHVVKAVKDIITGNQYPRVTTWNITNGHMIVHMSKGE